MTNKLRDYFREVAQIYYITDFTGQLSNNSRSSYDIMPGFLPYCKYY